MSTELTKIHVIEGNLFEVEGEKGLMIAILENALSDLNSKGRKRNKALQFFLSDEEDYLFSFRSICDNLNIDPEGILSQKNISYQNLDCN